VTWLGLVLAAFGLLDLARWDSEELDRRTWLGLVAGGLFTALVLGLGGVAAWAVAGTTVVVVLLALGWALASRIGFGEDGVTWPGLVVAASVVTGALLLSPYAPELGGPLERWYADLPWAALDDRPIERTLAVVGSALALTGTANVLVRLVLTASGSKVRRSEQQIKGGRVLGPMERLLILGLGLAGELGAASIIVAAKGLLRFPELQSYRAGQPHDGHAEEGREDDGAGGQRIDVLTEYFLIGSMTSWLLALLCLAWV
jgi:hypothetical protein